VKCTSSYTPAAGPGSSLYVFRGIFEGSQELQWQISKYVNSSGVSPTSENCNGLVPNNPYFCVQLPCPSSLLLLFSKIINF
jgi:hypothetical protein